MTKHTINIQDGFLFQNLKEGAALRIELTTGRSLAGKLLRFDRFALVVECDGSEMLVYKHAIALITGAATDS
jgi:host factor-I protein